MRSRSAFPMPLPALIALAALVLVVHALVLSGHTTAWMATAGTSTVMATRQIAAAPTIAEAPVAPLPVARPPAPAGSRKKPPASVNSKPNMPLAKENIAQSAPEIVAKYEAVTAQPPLTSPASSPTETFALRDEPAPAASPDLTVSIAAPDASLSATSTGTLTPAQRAKLEADAAQRKALKLQFPPSGELSYNATQISGGQPKSGSGTLKWTTDGSDYQLRLESSALFITLLTQTSVGKLGAEGLLPERFSDKRFNRSERAAHFQRDTGKITFSGNQPSLPLQSGAQDRLSVLMQLAAMAAGSADQLAQAGQLSLQVANTEEADTWLFVVQEAQNTQVPAGQAMAMHMVRTPRKDFDSRLELWLAPSLGYLPIRIKQTESNGNTLELQLRSPSLR